MTQTVSLPNDLTAIAAAFDDCLGEINATALSRIELALKKNPQIVGLVERAKSDKRLAADVRATVREKFRRVFEESALLRHAIDKPFGYPGDCWILETLYDGVAVSQSDTGNVIDLWCMQTALPQAVVERKDILSGILQQYMSKGDGLEILSVASGSAREIRELPGALLARHRVTLLDSDPRVFDFFHQKGGQQCDCVQGNALDFHFDKRFDLVYSFGLFDYLSDRVLHAVIKNVLVHLKPQGVFVFALKDARFYTPALYDWFCDWRFKPRTEEDVSVVCAQHDLVIREIRKTNNKAVVVVVCERKTTAD